MNRLPKRRSEDEDDIPQRSGPVSIVQQTRSFNTYNIRIDGYLENSSDFRGFLNLLEFATEDDTIIIRLSSGGGELEIAQTIRNALKACQAKTVIVLDSWAASAATMFFNVVDQVVVQPCSYIMVHGASYGKSGHMSDIKSYVEFSEKRIRSVFKEAYEGFLTDEEMERILSNDIDVYMEEDEIVERLEKMQKHFQDKSENTAVDAAPKPKRSKKSV